MKAENLNSWLTLFANVGVVIGLVLLVVEIRQNTDMMRAQMTHSRSETAMLEQQAVFNSPYLPAIILKARRSEELTEEELFRYRTFLRSFHRNQENIFSQFNQGYLDDNIPPSIREAIRTVLGSDALSLEIWNGSKQAYTEAYRDFVDQAIEDLR